MNILNYADARDEADRLSRMTKRDVEIKADRCCEFDESCGTCFGQGYVYALVYRCGHIVPDGPDEECEREDCLWKEYTAGIQREEQLEASYG